MKDYIGFYQYLNKQNIRKLSFDEGQKDLVSFGDMLNVSYRFLNAGDLSPEDGFLILQAAACKGKKYTGHLFISQGFLLTDADVDWIFQDYARSDGEKVHVIEEMKSKVYTLQYSLENTNIKRSSDLSEMQYSYFDFLRKPFTELSRMLADANATILVVAGHGNGMNRNGTGSVFILLADEMSVRLRAMFSAVFPGVSVQDAGGFSEPGDKKYCIPDHVFLNCSATLLYAFITYSGDDKTEKTDISFEDEELFGLGMIPESEPGIAEEEHDCNDGPVSIDVLELSSRSYHCLLRAGINTIEELSKKSDDDLRCIRNLGFRNTMEIRQKLSKYYEDHPQFIEAFSKKQQAKSYYNMLEELIGLEDVKKQVKRVSAFARMRKAMEDTGNQPEISMNMEFLGNPGTAKTTVARIIAGIFHEIGLLSSAEIVEVGRANLIAQYEGQTADKVKAVFQKAKGKVLFIDEAYSLVEHWEGAFGDEAISTIVQEMENNRENTVVIFAGYPDKMKEFFERNPGMRSRVPFHIQFKDYSAEEMVKISELEIQRRGFSIDYEAREKLFSVCEMAVGRPDLGNGRFCRNLAESAILNFASRVYGGIDVPEGVQYVLSEEDIIIPSGLAPSERDRLRMIGFRAS